MLLFEPRRFFNGFLPANRFQLSAAVWLSIALLSGCATTVITPEIEEKLGSEMSVQVRDQIGLYADPELDAYLQGVGERLVTALMLTKPRDGMCRLAMVVVCVTCSSHATK